MSDRRRVQADAAATEEIDDRQQDDGAQQRNKE
jgi:hypothetical protein